MLRGQHGQFEMGIHRLVDIRQHRLAVTLGAVQVSTCNLSSWQNNLGSHPCKKNLRRINYQRSRQSGCHKTDRQNRTGQTSRQADRQEGKQQLKEVSRPCADLCTSDKHNTPPIPPPSHCIATILRTRCLESVETKQSSKPGIAGRPRSATSTLRNDQAESTMIPHGAFTTFSWGIRAKKHM